MSWQVKGVRNNLWIQNYGVRVGVERDPAERSKYQHPELYGKPAEMGLLYRPPSAVAAEPPMAGSSRDR